MDAIRIDQLTKVYKPNWPGLPPVKALTGLSLEVKQGEIFGFLGPNGAGKTTTLKILMGLVRPTSGKAEIFGTSVTVAAARRRIGFLPEAPYFYDYLTAEEFLEFYGGLGGLDRKSIAPRIGELLELVGLAEARTRQLRKFSKGMLQRIGLAQALIHDPDLVVLDEPMSGLDPVGRKQIRDLILNLRDRGKTVFFSSHIIPDVEMLCDRVAVIMKGGLVAVGRVEDLVHRGHNHSVEVICQGVAQEDIEPLRPMLSRVWQQGPRLLIVLPSAEHLGRVLDVVRLAGGTLISVIPHKGSLEEFFLDGRKEPVQV